MIRRIRESLLAYLQRGSLRRRLAYSLAIVRLILVPVIFLAIYYLFVMGRIVDRIVNEDAPAATLAQQASIEMLLARRAERTFLLLRDSDSVHTVDQSLNNVEETLSQIQALQPEEQGEIQRALTASRLYTKQFHAVTSIEEDSENNPASQLQTVIQDYEKSLSSIIKRNKHARRTQLVDELRTRVESFDDQIASTIQSRDPALQKVSSDLQNSSEEVLQTLSSMEKLNWDAVQEDHRKARQLLHRAEWTLSIVSGLTFLLSVWISFILPRQLVRPLVRLKQAVDRAIFDNHDVNLNIHADGELGELAESIRHLIAGVHAGNPIPKD